MTSSLFVNEWKLRLKLLVPPAAGLDTKGVAEDLDGIGVGVQRPGDGGDQVPVFRQCLVRRLL